MTAIPNNISVDEHGDEKCRNGAGFCATKSKAPPFSNLSQYDDARGITEPLFSQPKADRPSNIGISIVKNSRKISDLFPDFVQNIWQREQSNESGSGENALDQSSDKFLAATICPICSSAECKSNRIPNAEFAESLSEAFTDYRAGRRGLAAKTLAAWSFVEVASILRGKRVCNYCQHTW